MTLVSLTSSGRERAATSGTNGEVSRHLGALERTALSMQHQFGERRVRAAREMAAVSAAQESVRGAVSNKLQEAERGVRTGLAGVVSEVVSSVAQQNHSGEYFYFSHMILWCAFL